MPSGATAASAFPPAEFHARRHAGRPSRRQPRTHRRADPIEVAHPERTIVRDEALPLILAGTTL